jgi:hypothetical protein
MSELHRYSMTRLRTFFLLVGLATTFTLASSLVPGKANAIQLGDPGCENDCEYVAAGWPLPYIVDGPGISPTGSVDLMGAFFGVDSVIPAALATDYLFWFILLLASAGLTRILRLRRLDSSAR